MSSGDDRYGAPRACQLLPGTVPLSWCALRRARELLSRPRMWGGRPWWQREERKRWGRTPGSKGRGWQ
eukprot:4627282-Heterocapsa_arctica.AAC.1